MVAPQPFFRPRGTPFSVLHRIRALIRLGHHVELVTYPIGENPAVDGLVVHRGRRPPGIRDVPIGPSVAKLVLDGPLFLRVVHHVRRGGFDLLHTHEEAGFLGAWLSRRYGIPHLYDMHSSLPQQFANFGRYDLAPVVSIFRRLERYTLARTDAVIAICADLEEHARRLGYGGPLGVIENSLDFDVPEIDPLDVLRLRQRLGLGDAPVVVYTGTLERYQGLDLLVAAAPAVLDRVPAVRFVIVGGTAGQLGELRRLAVDRGVERAFVFVPAVPPLAVFAYHRMADALVTCRIQGTNTPLKVYQYLRAGKPIVATAVRSHTQVLDGATAELVAPSAGTIADGLVRVLVDRSRAAALASAASHIALTRYTTESYLGALRGLLEHLSAGTPVAAGGA